MKHIKAILWDMDGVKYFFGKDLEHHFRHIAATMAVRYLSDLDYETALAMAYASYTKYHSCWEFMHYDYGLDRRRIQDELHETVDIASISRSSADYIAEMQKQSIIHGLLTHGHRPWVKRVLEKTGMDKVLHSEFITTDEDIYPHRKSNSEKPFLLALEKMNVAPEETIMVEDSQHNLEPAKALGMTTVFVHPKDGSQQAAYTDHMFDTPYDFLKAFNKLRETEK
jgi:putative hydrolase of the HAD superfamily